MRCCSSVCWVEQDCVTLLTPPPPCACETLATPVTSTFPGSSQGGLRRGCTVTQGWALSPSVKTQTFICPQMKVWIFHNLPQCSKNPRPIQTPQTGSSINISQKTPTLLPQNLVSAKNSTDAICTPPSQIFDF